RPLVAVAVAVAVPVPEVAVALALALALAVAAIATILAPPLGGPSAHEATARQITATARRIACSGEHATRGAARPRIQILEVLRFPPCVLGSSASWPSSSAVRSSRPLRASASSPSTHASPARRRRAPGDRTARASS